jgi:hypothetical protein
MANNNLISITLFPNALANSTSVTLTSNSWSAAATWIMQLPKSGGFFDQNNVWFPLSAVAAIVIS